MVWSSLISMLSNLVVNDFLIDKLADIDDSIIDFSLLLFCLIEMWIVSSSFIIPMSGVLVDNGLDFLIESSNMLSARMKAEGGFTSIDCLASSFPSISSSHCSSSSGLKLSLNFW